MRRIEKTGKLKAFTLNELLVVLIIVGILTALALPRLLPLVTKAKTTEAKLQLEYVHTLQQAFYMEKSKYSNSLMELGYQGEKLVTEGGSANYVISIENASNTNYLAKASSVTDFDNDGVLNVWQIDHEKNLVEIQPD
jgi:type IV pilus assembly protein PilE